MEASDTAEVASAAAAVKTTILGCKHYRRRCRIRAPCCNQLFSCRHCHNESTSEVDRHKIPRRDIQRVICSICDTEQPVAQVCNNCGVKMGEYFCGECKFFDDDTRKGQYHCDECGVCRLGGRDNFFHRRKCAQEEDNMKKKNSINPCRHCTEQFIPLHSPAAHLV